MSRIERLIIGSCVAIGIAAVAIIGLGVYSDYVDTTVAGTVKSKTHVPGFFMIQTIPCGNGCSTTSTIWIPDCEKLVVDTDEGERRGICVKKNEWDKIEVGGRYVGDNYEKARK